jgi:RimJ/RimL family protein N-acetyltransferase
MPQRTDVPTLTNGVVTLRAHRPEDVPRVVEQGQDPDTQAWTQVPVPYDVVDAEQFVNELVPGWWGAGTEWAFAVEVGGEFGGTVSLRDEGNGRVEVAFGGHPAVRGTGAMERALRLLLEWGFAEQGATTVVWRAFVGNWPSRRLAWRLGFTLEGTLRRYLPQRGALRDAWVGTLLRDDPREPRTTWLEVPELEGDGFRLRRVRESDAPRIHEGTAEPTTQRWLGHKPAPYTLDDADAYIQRRYELAASGECVTWAIADPVDDRLLGTVLWFNWTPGVECEIGWWTHPEARGRGLATKAARLVTGHVFETLEVKRVTAFAAVENTASRRVAEAAGFRQYGVERYGAHVRDDWVDMALYDVTASDWAAASGDRSAANPTASTANPASDSSAPMSNGDR